MRTDAAFGSSNAFTSCTRYQRQQSIRRSTCRSALHTKASYEPYSSNGSLPYTSAGTPAGSSKKVQDYLKSPFDLAAFGPRLAFGAALSANTFLANLQSDVEKASTLLQGPRPQAEKQELLTKEIEARLTEYLQKGASLEAELFTALADVLPQDVKENMPPELKDILLRGSIDKQVPPTPPTYQEASAVPIATVAKTQTAAELEDLRALVASLRVSMSELTNNTDPAERGVLEVNVRDARAGLSRGVQRLTPITQASMDVPVEAAKNEAQLLLREAEALNI